jgi:predicted nucleotidyltransferase
MGHELSQLDDAITVRSCPPWLDAATSALVDDIVATLEHAFPDLLAIILFGSVARHEERPLEDSEPSDMDLLAVFDTHEEVFAAKRGRFIFPVLGQVYCRHLDAAREVKVMLASHTLAEWDPAFVANVTRDGVALFARGPLPVSLSTLTERTL